MQISLPRSALYTSAEQIHRKNRTISTRIYIFVFHLFQHENTSLYKYIYIRQTTFCVVTQSFTLYSDHQTTLYSVLLSQSCYESNYSKTIVLRTYVHKDSPLGNQQSIMDNDITFPFRSIRLYWMLRDSGSHCDLSISTAAKGFEE